MRGTLMRERHYGVSSLAFLMILGLVWPVSAANTGKSKAEIQQEAVSYYNRGIEYVDQENYKRAEYLFRKAVQIKSDFAEAHNMLGFSLRKQGKYDKAIKSYKRALKLDPELAEAHEYIGEAYLGLGDRESAWKHYTTLVELESDEALELLENIEEYDRRN
jgi:tetratricopeptide (TPR) repeat protein